MSWLFSHLKTPTAAPQYWEHSHRRIPILYSTRLSWLLIPGQFEVFKKKSTSDTSREFFTLVKLGLLLNLPMTEPSLVAVDGGDLGQKNHTPLWVSSSSSPCFRFSVLHIYNSFMSVPHTKLGMIAAYLQNNQSKRPELYFNISSITIQSEGM